MKTYWDSSALILALSETTILDRLAKGGGITRIHSLAEIFSALTGGNLSIRVKASAAQRLITGLAAHLKFVDLTASQVFEALKSAEKLGVRGGRVHDFMHAVASQRNGCERLLTSDENDFDGLTGSVKVEQV